MEKGDSRRVNVPKENKKKKESSFLTLTSTQPRSFTTEFDQNQIGMESLEQMEKTPFKKIIDESAISLLSNDGSSIANSNNLHTLNSLDNANSLEGAQAINRSALVTIENCSKKGQVSHEASSDLNEEQSESVAVPIMLPSGSACQILLTKLPDTPNSNGLPILIKVVHSDSNVMPTTAVAGMTVMAVFIHFLI